MLSSSGQFDELVSGEHEAICKAEVERDGAIIRTLDVIDGVVDADRSALNMRRFTASVVDSAGDLTPVDVHDLLAPFGTLVRLFRGVRIKSSANINDVRDSNDEWHDAALMSALASSDGDLRLGWED